MRRTQTGTDGELALAKCAKCAKTPHPACRHWILTLNLGSDLILQEDIPSELIRPTKAALAWINQERGESYRLTGLVGVDAALTAKPGEAFEIGMVLCSGDVCAREQVVVRPEGNDFGFSFLDQIRDGIPALLDPPEGVRSTWIDDRLADKKLIILLFYRGLW